MLDKEELVQNSKKIHGWLSDNEGRVLFDLADKHITKGGLAVEIGSWKGKSGYIIGSVCKEKEARLYCIDTFAGVVNPRTEEVDINLEPNSGGTYREALNLTPTEFIKMHIKKNLVGLPVTYVIGSSTKVHTQIPKDLDFCFVDGGHTEFFVQKDIENFWPKLRKGGILCGHDYALQKSTNNDVKRVVDAFFDKRVRVFDTIWVVEK